MMVTIIEEHHYDSRVQSSQNHFISNAINVCQAQSIIIKHRKLYINLKI
jgi:hypothetical protein